MNIDYWNIIIFFEEDINKKMTKENDQKRNVIKLEGDWGKLKYGRLVFFSNTWLTFFTKSCSICLHFFTYTQTSQTRHLTFVWEIPFTCPKYTEGLVRLWNIAAKTLFIVMFPGVAKLAGNKQNVLLPRCWLNVETLSRKTKGHSCAL